MRYSTHFPIRRRLLSLAAVLLLPALLTAQQPGTLIDFEDLSGTLTTSPLLDSLGIRFGDASIPLTGLPDLADGGPGPVTVFTNQDNAPSGENVAFNCDGGISCEFPSGAVLFEFADGARRVDFRLRASDQSGLFNFYAYDDRGVVRQLGEANATGGWQRISLEGAKGYIIELQPANASRSFAIDDILYLPETDEPPLQRTCGTGEELLDRLQNDRIFRAEYDRILRLSEEYLRGLLDEEAEALQRGGEVVTIPVVVHVVYGNATQNVSDAQINSQIDALNEAFRALNADISTVPSAFSGQVADFQMQFALARRDPNCEATTGITRTPTDMSAFNFDRNLSTGPLRNPVKFTSSGGRDGWPSDRYLNLWVCNLAGFLGYASFPADLAARPAEDGVVIDYQYFGDMGTATAPYDLGRTGVHEVGHWLNLRHIWGDDNLLTDQCSVDDGVADTPLQRLENYGCPSFPSTSCMNGPDGDQFMNYMDYVDDDCMTMFTVGQQVRAAAALFTTRSSIVGSQGHLPPPAVVSAPDLWMADTPEDIGDEPNASPGGMHRSPDIWIRPTNDGFLNQEHQNPVFSGTDPNYVYVRVRNRGCGGPEAGMLNLYWAKASSGLSWPNPWTGAVTSPALMGNPIGSTAVSVDGDEFMVYEFPWTVPDPADYSSFGADRAHFCLLARLETPGGMTFPEGSGLSTNVRNNNNIAWKNITIGEAADGGGRTQMAQILVANYHAEPYLASLQFGIPVDEVRQILEYGRVFIHLRELTEVWRENQGRSFGVEEIDEGVFEVLDPEAEFQGIPLDPGMILPIEVHFEPGPQARLNTVLRYQVQQIDLDREAVIGGNEFHFPLQADGLQLPPLGDGGGNDDNPFIYAECPGAVPTGCAFPLEVHVDMSNVPAPNQALGNFTGRITFDPTILEFTGISATAPGFTGFRTTESGVINFNGASSAGATGDVQAFTATFRAIGTPGTPIEPEVSMSVLAAAGTFESLLPASGVENCSILTEAEAMVGDVNGDGAINSTDAAAVLAVAVGNPVPAFIQARIDDGAGDVNADGITSAADALRILSFELGLIDEFPAGNAYCPDDFEPGIGRVGIPPGTPRSGLTAPVTLCVERDVASAFVLPVSVDMRGTGELLGSYQLSVAWDAEHFRFDEILEGEQQEMAGFTVNRSTAEEGYITVAYANAIGAPEVAELFRVRLVPTAGDTSVPEVKLAIAEITTALTFLDVTPEVSYHEATTAVPEVDTDPTRLRIVPNPVAKNATLQLTLAEAGPVAVTIRNAHGQLVARLAGGVLGAGKHTLTWAPSATLPNGVYLVQLLADGKLTTRRLVLAR